MQDLPKTPNRRVVSSSLTHPTILEIKNMKKTFYIYNDNGEFISEFTGIKTYCKQNGYNNFGTLTTTLNFNSNNTETIRSFHGIYPLFEKEKMKLF